jgi:Zn finger protein HypA/HybF involved in hydrogenase expression
MHSLAMARSILDNSLAGAAGHGAKRISGISINVSGDFDEADSLLFCLEALSKGTIAEGAAINLKCGAANAHCDAAVSESGQHGHSGPEAHSHDFSVELELD